MRTKWSKYTVGMGLSTPLTSPTNGRFVTHERVSLPIQDTSEDMFVRRHRKPEEDEKRRKRLD